MFCHYNMIWRPLAPSGRLGWGSEPAQGWRPLSPGQRLPGGTAGRPQSGLSSVWPLRWQLLSSCSSAARHGLSYSSHETAAMPDHGPLGPATAMAPALDLSGPPRASPVLAPLWTCLIHMGWAGDLGPWQPPQAFPTHLAVGLGPAPLAAPPQGSRSRWSSGLMQLPDTYSLSSAKLLCEGAHVPWPVKQWRLRGWRSHSACVFWFPGFDISSWHHQPWNVAYDDKKSYSAMLGDLKKIVFHRKKPQNP